jgi:cyclohexadieny/prephenate dehydrogenase
MALGFLDRVEADPASAVAGADAVMICAPMGAYEQLAQAIAPALAPGAIVTDVGSVKGMVARTVAPYLPAGVHLVPGHPIAGTEHSGPSAGFAELFIDRWCVLTPEPDVDPDAVAKVEALWRGMGMMVERMTAEHHDRVLAITSHIPHLIAYTIVGTASDMEEATQAEVIRFSAGGFRDFTRIAGSDPVMWRDVFLTNRGAVLEVLQQFTEDLVRLQRAIRRGEGDKLESWFTRTRAIRRGVVDAHQEEMEPEKAARLTKDED